MKRLFAASTFLPAFVAAITAMLSGQGTVLSQRAAVRPNLSSGTTTGFQLTRRITPRPAPLEFHGVHIFVKPDAGQMAVTARISNGGGGAVSLPGPIRWEFALLDSTGNLIRTVRRLRRPLAPGSTAYKPIILKPGKSLSSRPLSINVGSEGRGTFYIFVQRGVAASGGRIGQHNSVTIRSRILKLSIHPGKAPTWKIMKTIPQSTLHAPAAPLPVRPPFPPYRIPSTGPVAVLAEISKAVGAGDIQAVKRLCRHGSRQPPPLYVANAEEAIAVMKSCRAVGKQFGQAIGAKALRHLEQTRPSPKGFSRSLKALNFRSLRINRDRASVGTFWFNGKQIVPMPKFAFRFRKVNGHWLLDSRATCRTTTTPREYQLNVENSVKETQIFDSLSRELSAGRFATLAEFTAVADRKMAAENDWFDSQSLHGAPRPAANSGRPAVLANWAVIAHGVAVNLTPGTGTNVVATLANNGNQIVSLLTGWPFGWSLFVFGANGRSMGISPKEQARLRAAARQVGHIPLACADEYPDGGFIPLLLRH